MALDRFNENMDIIAGLGDDPKRDDGLSTPQFKSAFDKAGLLIQKFLNEKLIPQIENTVNEDGLLAKIAAALNNKLSLSGGTMEGGINMNGQKLTGLNAPTADDEAANKGYVDQHTNPPLPGVIYPYSGANIPDGFLLCDGAAYSRTEHPELFAAIGTMYGSGDGSTTFNVPDLVERVPAGAGDNHAAGEMVGAETHTLTVDEMPNHNHTVQYNSSNNDGADWVGAKGTSLSGDQGTTYTGGSQPHNIMQPTTFIRGYIIATGKGSGVSVQDIIAGVQALPLGVQYGGTGATDAKTARDNLGITPDNIGALSRELLWENGAKESAFALTTIPVMLDEGDTIFITHNRGSTEGKVGNEVTLNYSRVYDSYTLDIATRFVRISRTSIEIGDCYKVYYNNEGYVQAKEVKNDFIIPHSIYLVKGVLA